LAKKPCAKKKRGLRGNKGGGADIRHCPRRKKKKGKHPAYWPQKGGNRLLYIRKGASAGSRSAEPKLRRGRDLSSQNFADLLNAALGNPDNL